MFQMIRSYKTKEVDMRLAKPSSMRTARVLDERHHLFLFVLCVLAPAGSGAQLRNPGFFGATLCVVSNTPVNQLFSMLACMQQSGVVGGPAISLQWLASLMQCRSFSTWTLLVVPDVPGLASRF